MKLKVSEAVVSHASDRQETSTPLILPPELAADAKSFIPQTGTSFGRMIAQIAHFLPR
jgi:hypothetical protein